MEATAFPSERQRYFNHLQSRLMACHTMDATWHVFSGELRYNLEFRPFDTSLLMQLSTDEVSKQLLSTSKLDHLHPIPIYGNGNCLPRVVSMFLTGDEESMNQEIRVRISIELIKHVDFYLNNDVLAQGLLSKTDLASRYATYFEQYMPDSVLTKQCITGFDAEACWPLNGPLFSPLNPLYSHCVLLWG